MTFLTFALSTAMASSVLPPASANWQAMDASVPLACTNHQGATWCRTEATYRGDMPTMIKAIQNTDRFVEESKALSGIEDLSVNVKRVVLDFPYPFSDRDYVVRYTLDEDPNRTVYRFQAVHHPGAPPQDDIVRLNRMAGVWDLMADGANTRFRYSWVADLGGDFPEWALEPARKKTAESIINDLGAVAGVSVR